LEGDKKTRTWPLARISKVFPGKDGEIRTVELDINGKTLVRPTRILCPVEGER